ncbi:MAG: hypothetical protein AAGF28_12380 [Pseudomonadota bacterium]
MKYLAKTVLAAMVALSVVATTAYTPAEAHSRKRHIGAGIAIGAIAGIIIADKVYHKKKRRKYYKKRYYKKRYYGHRKIYYKKRYKKRYRHHRKYRHYRGHRYYKHHRRGRFIQYNGVNDTPNNGRP